MYVAIFMITRYYNVIKEGKIMTAIISSSMSALNAFGKKMQVSANNVANMYSDDFKKSRAVLSESPKDHVTVDISRIDTPGPLVEDPTSETGELKELSNTDIAEEFSQQIIAEKGFTANTKAIQTHDEMLGTIVNIIE